LKTLLPEEPIIKSAFSCVSEPTFMRRLSGEQRLQVLLTGIESHVCVHQTVYELIQRQYDVHVAVDAISARSLETHELALRRMQQDGAKLSTTEMAMCEWAGGADHPRFRDILNLMKTVS
jgi:nicotinamidase-related amidase